MLSIAIYNSGKQALEAFEKIGQFFSIVSQKTVSEQDKAAASKLLAAAMVVLGLAAIKLIFKKVTSRNSTAALSGGFRSGCHRRRRLQLQNPHRHHRPSLRLRRNRHLRPSPSLRRLQVLLPMVLQIVVTSRISGLNCTMVLARQDIQMRELFYREVP
jgi:hypothetical protein